MVKSGKWFFAGLLLSATVVAEDLNYDTYLEELNDGQQRIDYSNRLVKHRDLHVLLEQEQQAKEQQKKEMAEQAAGKKRVAESEHDAKLAEDTGPKPSDSLDTEETAGWSGEVVDDEGQHYEADGSQGEKTGAALSVTPGRRNNGGYYYVAPSLRQGGEQVSNNIQIARNNEAAAYFGITIGSEISVDLKKAASNVQEGYVALSVRFDVVGQQHSLSRNGTLFARPTAVKGSERLFLRIERGITPDGYEFAANGVVLGDDGKPGLVAKVISDGKVLERALNAGEDSVAGAVVGLMAPDVASGAAASGVKKILDDKQQSDNDKSGQRAYIVLAEPQQATVQVEATF